MQLCKIIGLRHGSAERCRVIAAGGWTSRVHDVGIITASMRSFARTRTVVKSAAVLSIAGCSLAGLSSLQPQSGWNVSSSGIIRFGRAAVAVACVVVDYKLTLRSIDPSSEQYLLLKSQVTHVYSSTCYYFVLSLFV